MKAPSSVNPNSDYKDKYSHLIGKVAAKDAAHTLEANKAYGCGKNLPPLVAGKVSKGMLQAMDLQDWGAEHDSQHLMPRPFYYTSHIGFA